MSRKPLGNASAWLALLRLEYQGDNFLPYFTATALAAARRPEAFEARWVALGVATLVVAQAALELLDGYHDHRQGAHGRKDGAPTWTGGSGALAEGRVPPAHVNRAAWLLGALACALFAALVAGRTGSVGLAVGAAGCVAGAGWAMPPLKLSYRGLGEVVVAVVAGPLMSAQGWLVAAGRLDAEALWAGVPFGLWQFAMAMAHGIVDCDDDARAGKRTLVVRLGRARAARAYAATVALAFASLVPLVASGVLPAASALALAALPLAARSARAVAAAAGSPAARERLARAYPPYKLLVAAGLALNAAALARAVAERPALGAALAGAVALAYAPVGALLARRWGAA